MNRDDYRRNGVMPRNWLLMCAVVSFAVFIVAGGGATPRYNRIVYGALPLVVALVCLGAVVYLRGRDLGSRSRIGLGVGCWLLAAVALVIWVRPSLAGAAPREQRIERVHVLLTLAPDRLRTALFAELQPVELANCQLQRFGEPHDGGYLMCGNLLGFVKAGYHTASRDTTGGGAISPAHSMSTCIRTIALM